MTGSPEEMRYLANSFNKDEYTVYCPVIAGHCNGANELANSTWVDWINSVEDSLKIFNKDINHIYCIGICVGGYLASLLAYRNPDKIKAIAWYSPGYLYNGWNIPYYQYIISKYFNTLLKYIVKLPLLKNINIYEKFPYGIKNKRIRNILIKKSNEFTRDVFPYYPLRLLVESYYLHKHCLTILSKINEPIIIIHSKEDDVFSDLNALELIKKLNNKSNLILIKNSYHMIHLDQEKNKVLKYTKTFFESFK